MTDDIFQRLFLVFLVAYYVLVTWHRLRNARVRRSERRLDWGEGVFMTLAFVGDTVMPLVYIFSRGLDWADYLLPVWLGWLGAVLFAASLWLLWRGHLDLGRHWSPMLELREQHALVTQGVYRYVRHPIYAARWVWAIAQVLLLQNWIAGLANGLLFLPIYMYRVPREERMMAGRFGEEYTEYTKHTGRVFPRWSGR